MEQLSKPELTNLIRYLDKKKLLSKKIRYASIRPKTELIEDIKLQFRTRLLNQKL